MRKSLDFIVILAVVGFGTAMSAQRPRSFEYSWIEVEGARSTSASGINAGGDIVGNYVDQQGVRHGFLFRGGAFTTIDYPDAEGTLARGIGPGGDIVGG